MTESASRTQYGPRRVLWQGDRQSRRFPCQAAIGDNRPVPGSGGPFPQDALDANRSGRLTDKQRRGWLRLARERRKGIRGMAYVFGAIGVVLLIATGPASKALTRELAGIGFLGVAVALLGFAMLHTDALTADVRAGRVEAVEGAIGKYVDRPLGGSRNATTFYLDVGGQRVRVWSSAYDAAPDAGFVRVFYLPRSRRAINLERLPDPPVELTSEAPTEIFKDFAQAIRSHNRSALNEARANAAAFETAVKKEVQEISTPPSGERDSRPLAEILPGSWTNPLMTVTFSADGSCRLDVFGTTRRTGRWSIDRRGRLAVEGIGTGRTAEARVTGDQLTLSMDGESLTFTRRAGG